MNCDIRVEQFYGFKIPKRGHEVDAIFFANICQFNVLIDRQFESRKVFIAVWRQDLVYDSISCVCLKFDRMDARFDCVAEKLFRVSKIAFVITTNFRNYKWVIEFDERHDYWSSLRIGRHKLAQTPAILSGKETS